MLVIPLFPGNGFRCVALAGQPLPVFPEYRRGLRQPRLLRDGVQQVVLALFRAHSQRVRLAVAETTKAIRAAVDEVLIFDS